MNDNFTITRLPTLVNAEKLTPAELLQQYQRLEGEAIDQAQQLSDVRAELHRMNVIAHDYAVTFATLCDSYEAGDQAAILLMVKKLSGKRSAFKEKAKVH
jgi:hypothetical protein